MPFEIHNNRPFIFIHIPKTGGTMVKQSLGMQITCHRTAMDFLEPLSSYRIPLVPNAPSCTDKETLRKYMAPFEMLATQAHKKEKSLFWDVFKFSVVRNPWDRFCSMYYWHREDFGGLGEFSEFAKTLENREGIFDPDSQTVLRLTQTQYLSTATTCNAVITDFNTEIDTAIDGSGNPIALTPALGLYPATTEGSQLAMDLVLKYESIAISLNELRTALEMPIEATQELPRFRESENSKKKYKTNYQHIDEIYAVYKAYREDIFNFGYTFTGQEKCTVTEECHKRYLNETQSI